MRYSWSVNPIPSFSNIDINKSTESRNKRNTLFSCFSNIRFQNLFGLKFCKTKIVRWNTSSTLVENKLH